MTQGAVQSDSETQPENRRESSGFYQRLQQKLGASDLRSDSDLARLVEERLPLSTVDSLSSNGLSFEEIHEYISPRRTLVHRRSRNERLTRDESDRAVRIARIASLAEGVFGNNEKAARWLRKPKQRFEDRSPLEVVRTEAGGRLVEDMLLQLDHGFFA